MERKAIVIGATSGIVRAIEKGKSVKVIDWRYALLVSVLHAIFYYMGEPDALPVFKRHTPL